MKSKPQPTVAVPVESLLLTTARAAELFSVSSWEIRRLCRRGVLAYKKLSKTDWRITARSVKAFAEVSATNGRAA
ncbi:MAG: helix-turn-helix domain-containing protein [Candidatus Acidiferrales bacterium]